MNEIILASASPRRSELLRQVAIPFEVIVSDADEHLNETEPELYVKELSERKARAVARQRKTDKVILGADTVVVLDGEIMGKPADAADAFAMLRKLQGNTHQVYTGITLIYPDGKMLRHAERTEVHMYPMTDDEIRDYIATGEPFDKAGGYGIQGRSAIYIKGITGDYNNVVGLPVAKIYQLLKE